MESYINFLDRTNSFETAKLELEDRRFTPRDSLKSKVNPDNTFKNFYGDTIVFSLSEEVTGRVSMLIDALYQAVPECFAKRLPDESLHMTLHDLVNSENFSNVQADLHENVKIMKVIKHCKMIPSKSIRMKINNIINMVDTSLVLALQPCSKSDYQRLMKIYSIFEEVIKLPYPFTPHITLAYYSINGFSAMASQRLNRAVTRLNQGQSGFEFYIDTKNLVYQIFTKMNEYRDVLFFGK